MMFEQIRQLSALPGCVTVEGIKGEYGHDPQWDSAVNDPEWMEFLALCILDKRNGTNHAAYYG